MRHRIAPFGIAAGLLIVSLLAGYSAAVLDSPGWAVYGLAAVAVLTGAGGLALLGRAIWNLVTAAPPPPPPPPVVVESEQINSAVKNLDKMLADLESDSSRAAVLIADVNTYTQHLVRLTKAIALKADKMRADSEALSAALDAVAAGDPVTIAQAAGRVSDPHLREMLLCDVAAATYWAGVSRTIAAQLGTLQQWAAGYDRFVGNLLTDLSSAKARAAALTASKELAIVARPMLQIQAKLDDAQNVLQLQRRVNLGQAVGALPAVNAGLLGANVD